MGVHGLWELLAPVGRRVSVETLAGKTLAVDASIWMVQFIKAMRDEKGEMVRNAHLLGFFRRICKLLFLRTKPVFVFDGGTPALKRRTVIARRRQRENAQAKVRKTAEKLLLNHLKTLRLKELANDIKHQRQKQDDDAKGPKKSNETDFVGSDSERSHMKEKELEEMSVAKSAAKVDRNLSQAVTSTSCHLEELDEMLAASIAAEENGILARKGLTSTVNNPSDGECDADAEMIMSSVNGEVDMAVLAALPHSMQLDILAQLKGKKIEGQVEEVDKQKPHEVNDRVKGKEILFNETDMVGCSSRFDHVTSRSENQEKIDEMLAASIAAEENANLVNNASTSLGASAIEEEDGDDDDDDEEMILPAMHGEVDPAVLASLPPSMQLDLLVQMRERLIAQNRQKYQKVKKDPAKFSELQIQAYLKTVAFRREIDEVQKAATGRGVGGVQTSRIASEANREYIFSSSFTGDKQELTSTRIEKNKEDRQQKAQGTHSSRNFVNSIAAGNDSNTSVGLVSSEPGDPVDESIQTYLDESGRFRVSRVRAMGMRMTRDLQRNLDLMKEIEQERTYVNATANIENVLNAENNGPSESSGNHNIGKSREVNVDFVGENVQNEQPKLDGDTSMEVSFEYDCKNKFINGEDDIFASLVGGNPVALFYADDTTDKVQPSGSDSDCDWEEGVIGGKTTSFPGHDKVELKSSFADEDNFNDSEVEWEEGDCDGAKSTSVCPAETGKSSSRGYLEEESDLQEAIRRSLENTGDRNLNHKSTLDEHSNAYERKLDSELEHDDDLRCSGPTDINDSSTGGSPLPLKGSIEPNEFHHIVDADKKLDYVTRRDPHTFKFHGSQSKSTVTFNSNRSEIDKPSRLDGLACSEDSISDANVLMKHEDPMVAEKLLDKHNDGQVSYYCNKLSKVCPLGVTEEEKRNHINESEPLSNSTGSTKPAILLTRSSLNGSTEDIDIEPKLPSVDNDGNLSEEKSKLVKDAMDKPGDFPAQLPEVRLEDEMEILGQEYTNLENEQRKLERNAESVNSELFTECQELLQMFGLPYIIAPMEAEAQCAYLELANLVDGVVTDDSDVFLFGARSVYKNIFDDRKYVETYFMEDIEKELGLTRENVIRMALLLGSDYTEGVSGIGIVNAIEVVNAFPEEDGLLKFRQWVESPDPTILGKLGTKSGSNTRKKGSKFEEKINIESTSDSNISHSQEQKESLDHIPEIMQTFMDNHRNVSKNWHIPPSFPSETVISAYCSPHVDKSTEPFTWGKPDHLVLRKLCWEKFGWTSQKADELLLPVLKEYNKRETQLRLEAFYSFNERFAKIRSKRIKKAVKGITGEQPSDLIDGSAEILSKSRKSGIVNPVGAGDNKFETLKTTEESLVGRKKSKRKESTKRKNDGDTVAKAQSKKKKIYDDPLSLPGTSEVSNLQSCVQTKEDQCDDNALVPNRRGRGKGRGRGRGGNVGVKEGKRKGSPIFESSETETSPSSSDIDDHGPRVQVDVSQVPEVVRRSKRSRKPVNYSFKDVEVEDGVDSFDQSNQTCLLEEQVEKSYYIHGECGDGATDFNNGKESSLRNFPLKENTPRDSLESEGRFCIDAGETSQPGTGNHDNSFDCGPSDDYLKAGGGFCLDDSETGNNNDAIDDVNTATEDYTTDFPHCSDFLDESDSDKNGPDKLFSGAEKAENEVEDGGTCHKSNEEPNDHLQNATPENTHHISGTSTGAFSAMPFLKKKRKN